MIKVKIKYHDHYKKEWDRLTFTPGNSAADARACLSEPLTIKAGERALVPLGISTEIIDSDVNLHPQMSFEIQVRPRSGLAAKNGIMIVNSPGTVDHNYRGEIKAIVLNSSHEDFTIQPGDRIAQLVLCPVFLPTVEAADELGDTNRGAGGFGSSGVK